MFDLTKYAVLSSAFMLLDHDVSGQVWYHDFIPDHWIEPVLVLDSVFSPGISARMSTVNYPLDMNNDGINDLNIYIRDRTWWTYSYGGRSWKAKVQMFGTNYIGMGPTYSYGHINIKRLLDGDSVATPMNFGAPAASAGSLYKTWRGAYSSSGVYRGDWMWGVSGAFAVEINVAGNKHYGWIRIGASQLLEDYMLNAIPDEPIAVGEYPCQQPFELQTPVMGGTTAVLTWTKVFNTTTYEVSYKLTTDATFTTVSSATNSITLTGLSPTSNYEWKVRASCDDGTFTPESDLHFFSTTLVPGISVPPLPGLSTE